MPTKKKQFNYTDKIESYLSGQLSIADIARNLVDSKQGLGKEMAELESSIQDLVNDGILTKKKVTSINAGLQRTTKEYSASKSEDGESIGIGVKFNDSAIEVYIVTATRDKAKSELDAAIARFKAVVKSGANQAECLQVASEVTTIMANLVPNDVAEAA